MVREVAPAGLGSTAGALNLCVRGLAGALGPVGIAQLSAHVRSGRGRMLHAGASWRPLCMEGCLCTCLLVPGRFSSHPLR